jgi:hypothetical protein
VGGDRGTGRAASNAAFTAFRGFEWTSDRFGHINVYFSRQAVNAKLDGGYAAMDAFWSWFARAPHLGGGGDGLATSTTPTTRSSPTSIPGRNWNDFAYVPAADDRMVGVELFNGGSRRYESWYVRALDKGWHVGAVGAEDSHGPSWATPNLAKTVLIARDRSPGALYEAMYARRMYAQLDADARIELTAAGQPMGSRIARPTGAQVVILASVTAADAAVTKLELVSNGGAVVATSAGPELAYQATSSTAERWYFCASPPTSAAASAWSPTRARSGSAPAPIRRADIGWRATCTCTPPGRTTRTEVRTTTTRDSKRPTRSVHSVASQFLIGAVRGLDYLAITDHNDIRSQSDPGFATQGLIGLPSYENSLRGHAQMHGATISSPMATARLPRCARSPPRCAARAACSRSTTRPANRRASPATPTGNTSATEATTATSRPTRSRCSTINSASSRRCRLRTRSTTRSATGRAGSTGASASRDGRQRQPLDSRPRRRRARASRPPWVFVTERSVRGVLAGIRAGRTAISHQPPALAGPRVYLEADGDRDGIFEAIVGDTVRAGARFRVRVEGGTGCCSTSCTTAVRGWPRRCPWSARRSSTSSICPRPTPGCAPISMRRTSAPSARRRATGWSASRRRSAATSSRSRAHVGDLPAAVKAGSNRRTIGR